MHTPKSTHAKFLLTTLTLLTASSALGQPSTTLHMSDIRFKHWRTDVQIPYDSNWFMDIFNSSQEEGVRPVLTPYLFSSTSQQFNLYKYPDGTFDIRAKHDNKCLDLFAGSLSEGAVIVQAICHGGPNQRWLFDDRTVAGYDFTLIVSLYSGGCLGVRTESGGHQYIVQNLGCGPSSRWFRFIPWPPL